MRSHDLHQKLKSIQKIFSVDTILSRDTEDVKSIAKYYQTNRIAYSLLNSRKGFVHMGISKDGKFKYDDFFIKVEL